MMHGETLDLRPSQGIIGITLRQTPHTMQMIGEQHPSFHIKRMFLAYRLHGSTQGDPDILVGQHRTAIMRHQREEIAASGYAGTAVVRHRQIVIANVGRAPPDIIYWRPAEPG